uniref:Uncharacterized protein n=1 Tax=Arundo donax TaxID=35708 RepID=A0A0A9CZ03_ARUDO
MASMTGNPVSSAVLLFHPFMLPVMSTAKIGAVAVSIKRTISFVTVLSSSSPCIFFISSDGAFTMDCTLFLLAYSSCREPRNISCKEWIASISISSQGTLLHLTTSKKALNDDRGCIFLPFSSASTGSCLAPPHLISFAVWDRNQKIKSLEEIFMAAMPHTTSRSAAAPG